MFHIRYINLIVKYNNVFINYELCKCEYIVPVQPVVQVLHTNYKFSNSFYLFVFISEIWWLKGMIFDTQERIFSYYGRLKRRIFITYIECVKGN
jgi:hypothetical protein